MKRAWLIAGGTVGGLGAVLAITPPQLSSDSASTGLEFTPTPTQTTAATTEPTPAATQSGQATKPAATQSATPAPSATQTTSGKAQSGTFVGAPYTMRYGTVQVKITINNGTITDAVAVTAPGGENQRYTDRAIPAMRQKTLVAQSSNITSVSGASYTAYAWYISLQSALSKAGWM